MLLLNDTLSLTRDLIDTVGFICDFIVTWLIIDSSSTTTGPQLWLELEPDPDDSDWEELDEDWLEYEILLELWHELELLRLELLSHELLLLEDDNDSLDELDSLDIELIEDELELW